MPDRMSDELTQFARGEHISEGEALSRAIALLALARREKEKGNCLAVARPGEQGKLDPIHRLEGV
jgi:hypothetical protein